MADELLPSLDEEFAALEAELQRLTATPPTSPADAQSLAGLLYALHAEWQKRAAERPDRPRWQKRIDDTLQAAVTKVLGAGHTINAAGELGYKLDTAAAQAALPEVVGAVQEGLTQAFVDKWTAPRPEGGKPAVDASDVGAVLAMLFGHKVKGPR
jgi:hypothetical protein